LAAKVLFLDTVHPVLEEKLTADGYVCEHDYTCSVEELKEKINNYTGLVLRSRLIIDEDLLSKAGKLSFIARSGSGLENIDVGYAKQKGISCFNSPEGNRDAVGEHAVGMLLSLLNNIPKGDSEVRKLQWNREENRGIELGGKTIGIIGYGNTGKAFAKKLSGFSCDVLTYDRYVENAGDANACQVQLSDIFEQSDIVSIHIPYNKENHYFIDQKFLSSFKKNVYLINTSRGKVLNSTDLVTSLNNGKIKGACLDVLEFEKHSFENMEFDSVPDSLGYLINSDKVILTPHVAGWTEESYYKLSLVLYNKISSNDGAATKIN
jgi:D-3-phosphoglycerate dehydrogenase